MFAQLPDLYPAFDDKVSFGSPMAHTVRAPSSPSLSSVKISQTRTTQVKRDSPNYIFKGEYHVPGYQYLGPGTRLETRQRIGSEPINELDRIAMYHDRGYSQDWNYSGMGATRAVGRSVHDLGAGAAMITTGLNPWSDAPLGLSLLAGSYLVAQGIARVHPYTFLPVGIADAILL